MTLTPREHELLRLLLLPNKCIARRLGIAEDTARNELTALYAKLGVPGGKGKRLAAIRRALDAGLVRLEDLDRADDVRPPSSLWHWSYSLCNENYLPKVLT